VLQQLAAVLLTPLTGPSAGAGLLAIKQTTRPTWSKYVSLPADRQPPEFVIAAPQRLPFALA
jgi:hypothetical protein